jgi:hypothetical protein
MHCAEGSDRSDRKSVLPWDTRTVSMAASSGVGCAAVVLLLLLQQQRVFIYFFLRWALGCVGKIRLFQERGSSASVALQPQEARKSIRGCRFRTDPNSRVNLITLLLLPPLLLYGGTGGPGLVFGWCLAGGLWGGCLDRVGPRVDLKTCGRFWIGIRTYHTLRLTSPRFFTHTTTTTAGAAPPLPINKRHQANKKKEG